MIPIKHPLESVIVEFDFASELSALTSAAVSLTVLEGATDAAVGAMLEGAAQVSGTKVLQRVGSGLTGLNYYLQCVGVNGLDKIVRDDILRVRRPV